jgi:hypothetical protein
MVQQQQQELVDTVPLRRTTTTTIKDENDSRIEDILSNVQNTEDAAGAETVMFFTFDDVRPTTPEYKRLRAFEKVHLAVGELVTIKQTIPSQDLRFVGPHDDKHYIQQDPEMTSWVGVGALTDCRINTESNDLCIHLQKSGDDSRQESDSNVITVPA